MVKPQFHNNPLPQLPECLDFGSQILLCEVYPPPKKKPKLSSFSFPQNIPSSSLIEASHTYEVKLFLAVRESLISLRQKKTWKACAFSVRLSSAAQNTWAEHKDRFGSQFQFITADFFFLIWAKQLMTQLESVNENIPQIFLFTFNYIRDSCFWESSTAFVLLFKFEIISTRMQSVLFQSPGTCSVCWVDRQSKPSHAMWFISKCIMETSEEGLLGVSSSWETFQKKWFAFVSYASLCVYMRSWAEMWACSWLSQRQRYSCHLALHTYRDRGEVFILIPSSVWFADTYE